MERMELWREKDGWKHSPLLFVVWSTQRDCARVERLYSLSGKRTLQSSPRTPSRFPRTALSIASAKSRIAPSSSSSPPDRPIPRLACSASSRADPRSPSILRSVSFSRPESSSPPLIKMARIAGDVANSNYPVLAIRIASFGASLETAS